MQIIRTIVWMLLIFAVLVFSWVNWDQKVTVQIWDNLVWDTRLPAVIILSFVAGFLPMWLLQRGTSWRLNRRIANLENAVRSAAVTAPVATADTASGALTSEPTEKPQPTL